MNTTISHPFHLMTGRQILLNQNILITRPIESTVVYLLPKSNVARQNASKDDGITLREGVHIR